MSTRLIFIRHGYSESNKDKLFTGQADIPLTDLGKIQAKCAAEFLKSTHIDKIYSSTLCRAYDTAKALADLRGMEIEKVKELCEIDGGDWTEMPFENIGSTHPEEYFLWQNDMYNCTCPNGEKVSDFFSRVTNAVEKIAKENEGKTVCIATHATPIRTICCLALGIAPKNLKSVPWSPNASINIIDYTEGKFEFVERDIVEHLKGFETNLPSTI